MKDVFPQVLNVFLPCFDVGLMINKLFAFAQIDLAKLWLARVPLAVKLQQRIPLGLKAFLKWLCSQIKQWFVQKEWLVIDWEFKMVWWSRRMPVNTGQTAFRRLLFSYGTLLWCLKYGKILYYTERSATLSLTCRLHSASGAARKL